MQAIINAKLFLPEISSALKNNPAYPACLEGNHVILSKYYQSCLFRLPAIAPNSRGAGSYHVNNISIISISLSCQESFLSSCLNISIISISLSCQESFLSSCLNISIISISLSCQESFLSSCLNISIISISLSCQESFLSSCLNISIISIQLSCQKNVLRSCKCHSLDQPLLLKNY